MKKIRKDNLDKMFIVYGVIVLLSLITAMALFVCYYPQEKPKGMMILIESTPEPMGLINMVSQMKERNIYGLLMVTPEFVKDNCEAIKDSLSYGNIELVASNVAAPFWGMSLEEQKTRITEMLEGIEKCTGTKPRIISSRYMASDLNTIRAAEELGVPYVTARGTTGNKATVFQPEGYKTKVLSVSLINLVPFEYGSLCDYSFYERAGKPEDMRLELDRSLEPLTEKEKAWFGEKHLVTPTSHTFVGGNLKPWNQMWLDFWDESEVDWVTLDELMSEVDWEIPLWQMPINQNNPYTEEKVHPLIPYEEEEKMGNMCAI